MGSTGWACVRSSMPSSAESRSTVTASKSFSVCLQREGVPEMGWNPLARGFCRIVQTRRHEIASGGSAWAVPQGIAEQEGYGDLGTRVRVGIWESDVCRDDFIAKQEPHPGHNAVAVADAHAGVGQVKLEAADVLTCRRVRGSLQKRSEPLAGENVTSLRARAQLARIHIFNHTLTQRGDSLGCHRQLLS